MIRSEHVIREVGRMEDDLDLDEVIAVAIRRKMELAVRRKEEEMLAERLAQETATGNSRTAYNVFMRYMGVSAPLAAETWGMLQQSEKESFKLKFQQDPSSLMKHFKETRLRERLLAEMIEGLRLSDGGGRVPGKAAEVPREPSPAKP